MAANIRKRVSSTTLRHWLKVDTFHACGDEQVTVVEWPDIQ